MLRKVLSHYFHKIEFAMLHCRSRMLIHSTRAAACNTQLLKRISSTRLNFLRTRFPGIPENAEKPENFFYYFSSSFSFLLHSRWSYMFALISIFCASQIHWVMVTVWLDWRIFGLFISNFLKVCSKKMKFLSYAESGPYKTYIAQ